ncbi:hypothetical protein GIR35_15015 [Enterococcus faecalis]|nr:hypothetical protein GIR35_15015 [Enterococcus faecalis]
MQLTLGRETREVHPEDYNEATYKKLLKKVGEKNQVCFTNGDGTREYGYVSNDRGGTGVFVKFSHTLLGFLYTEDAWQATTSKLCDRLQLEFVNPDTHD